MNRLERDVVGDAFQYAFVILSAFLVISTGAFDRNEMKGNGGAEKSPKLIDNHWQITFGEKVPPLRYNHSASLHYYSSGRNDG